MRRSPALRKIFGFAFRPAITGGHFRHRTPPPPPEHALSQPDATSRTVIQPDDIAFDILFEAAPNPYVLMDPAFGLVWMNQAYLQVTMRTREELVGRNMFEAFPSDPDSESHRQLRSSLERVVQTRAADQIPLIHYAIPRPDGGFDERFWSATHTPLLDDDGAVRLILQHTVDVTELQVLRGLAARAPRHSAVTTQVEGSVLRHAQRIEESSRALAQERDQLRQLFQQAPSFMAVLEGPEHVYTLANNSYARLVGPRQLLGRPRQHGRASRGRAEERAERIVF